MSEKLNPPPQAVYYDPLSPDSIEGYAHEVCHHMGDAYSDHETVRGFSTFVKIIADVQVSRVNRDTGTLSENRDQLKQE